MGLGVPGHALVIDPVDGDEIALFRVGELHGDERVLGDGDAHVGDDRGLVVDGDGQGLDEMGRDDLVGDLAAHKAGVHGMVDQHQDLGDAMHGARLHLGGDMHKSSVSLHSRRS